MQSQDRHSELRWMWVGLAVMFILIGAGIFISTVFRPVATTGFMGYSMGYPMGFGFGWIWGLAGIVFVIWIFGWVFSWMWWPSRRYSRRGGWYRDDAHQILRERYARGEITKEQFDQMTRDLEQRS